MSPTQSSLLTAGMICAASASVIAGIALRDKVELGGTTVRGEKVVGSALLASRTTDADIPESKYFTELSSLLKQRYVEPIDDDLKLAVGAVRGMVGSLNDVQCLFFTPELARAYFGAVEGDYQGIGADLILTRTAAAKKPDVEVDPETGMPDPYAESQLPRVVVSGVVPGGPADKAGVKPGDWVYSVNGHWVYNADELNKLRETKRLVDAGKKPSSALHDLSVELRTKAENAILPFRAFERLASGDSGKVAVVWNRPGIGRLTTNMERGVSHVDLVSTGSDGSISVRLARGVGRELRAALNGESGNLDLRSRSYGDFEALTEALEALGPAGTYGTIVREGDKPRIVLKTNSGSEKLKLTVKVDAYTGGLYQTLALALASKGATIVGPKPQAPIVATAYRLTDGSAFTLALGKFRTGGAN